MSMSKILDYIIVAVGIAAFGYHMLTTQVLMVGSYEHQTIHLMFVVTLIFLGAVRLSTSVSARLWYLSMLGLGLFATAYIYLNLSHLEMVIGFPETMDVIVGVILMLVVLEGTRQAWGNIMPCVIVFFVAYFFLGQYLPEPFYHRPFNFSYVVSYLSVGLSGIYGNFLSISANYVFLFVIFGALLEILRVHGLFRELGQAAGRVFRGGPGQTAVISSAMVGTVTGAAVANVAITGAFTIPYMKQTGYKPHIAAAIEATASTGGQLMPPVMGAAAFLMASFIGVSYASVMAASLIPALLYFWGCMLSVQLIAVRENIRAPRAPIDVRLIFRRLPLFLIPLGVLVVMLLMQYSANLAAFWAIIVAVVLSYISSDTRPTFKELAECLSRGAVIGAQIGIALAGVGMMAQALITTGMGTKVASVVEMLSGGSLALALVITMIVSIILGLGIPTSAAYALVAIVVVPVLIEMGVTPISAHFFAFYFAVVSAITPPVALASLAGAGIAGADYVKTSLYAFMIALAGFIIPFLVVYNPVLVLEPDDWAHGVFALIAVPIGMSTLAMAIFNCALTMFSLYERVLAIVSTALIVAFLVLRHDSGLPFEYPVLGIGLLIFAVLMMGQMRKRKAETTALPKAQPIGQSYAEPDPTR
ncbi:TRAP transporter, 4TM/12TM fusion protein [Candidatus Filomicrobium marinum]|uniref:TRAP transporter, 4TM/12TM fusion protein n=2 Tax=Candidatus Filomicrobium marinum TaxID=1608628 RepID=A0A0D6JBU2_9HYPH|nr:TRAP transporter fused permease subunit [Candidatus Filomicrobium marinum]CFX06426.1 TRAP transporter, 4TM/12TM fusion protein [Candidatus Filomicrobium marinum]CPR16431.1 TRAP transporter, 4TM/12TM fusion protein [Candidatus Filomicrobium marinum]